MLFLTAQCILNHSSLRCVGKVGPILPPRIDSVTHSSVTLSFRPPEGAKFAPGLVYIILYRKVGSRHWTSNGSEFYGLRRTIRGLKAKTRYELRVEARFSQGFGVGRIRSKVQSSSVEAKTKVGKCAVLNFPWMSLIYRMYSPHLSVYFKLNSSQNEIIDN